MLHCDTKLTEVRDLKRHEKKWRYGISATIGLHAFLMLCGRACATDYDLNADFSATLNPNGVWSAGYRNTLTAPFQLFTQSVTTDNDSINRWIPQGVANVPLFAKNVGQSTLYNVPAGDVFLHPGSGNEYASVIFTSPASALISLNAVFSSGDTGSTDALIARNGATLSPLFYSATTDASPSFQTVLNLGAGETIEFIVGANGGFSNDSTPIQVLISGYPVSPGSLRTPGSVPAASARPTDDAFIFDTYGEPTTSGTGAAFTYRNLDLLGSSSYELLPLDMLCLDDGNGTLYVGPGATFIGNGVVKGNIVNAGLTVIPITKVAGSLRLVSTPVAGVPGTILILPPEILPSEPIIIPPPMESGGEPIEGALFIGGSGGAFGGGGGGGGGTPTYIWDDDFSPIAGTLGFDGKLEVTGTYTQTSTGITRFYIAGEEQGVTYSQLDVGKAVTLDGTLQIVIRPELFDFLPQVGDSFDIITSDVGIFLSNTDLRIDTLITAEGASYLGGMFGSLATYSSGFAGDPDTLLDIVPDIFAFSIIDEGKTLRVTLVEPILVPEPSALVLGVICVGMLGWSCRGCS